MSYRNKTYVAFASEDIKFYRLMEAWKANEKIDFNFFDAHDLFISRDTSKPETIKRNLRVTYFCAFVLLFLPVIFKLYFPISTCELCNT